MRNRNVNTSPNYIDNVIGGQVRLLNLSASVFDGRYVRLSSSTQQTISSSVEFYGGGTLLKMRGVTRQNNTTLRILEGDAFDFRGGYLTYDGDPNSFTMGVHSTIDSLSSSDIPGITVHRNGVAGGGAVTMGTNLVPFSGSQVYISSSVNTHLLLMKGQGTPVGISQGYIGGTNTMELMTTDSTFGALSSRIIIRGGTDDADIEFWKGASGSANHVQTMFFDSTPGNMSILGDYSGSGGFKTFVNGMWIRSLAAAQTDLFMGQPNATTTEQRVIMPYAGSIIGFSGRHNAGTVISAGSASFQVAVNGVANVSTTVNIAAGSGFSTTFPKDQFVFNAGDSISVRYSTTAAFAGATGNWNTWVVVEF